MTVQMNLNSLKKMGRDDLYIDLDRINPCYVTGYIHSRVVAKINKLGTRLKIEDD